MKFTTTKLNSDPAQNYSQHFRNQNEKNLAWKNPIIASRKLVLTILQVDMATKKLVQTISAVLPVVLCSKDYHSYERKKVDSYSRQSFVRRSSVATGLHTGYKDGTSLRSRRTRTRWIISFGHREVGIAEGVLGSMEH